MARVRVVMADDWREFVDAAAVQMFDEKLGPAIADDARRYVPVDTGALRDSIEHHVEDHKLIVSATGGAGDPPRTYAAYVELGHRVGRKDTAAAAEHPDREAGEEPDKHEGVVPPQPFLRPALYQLRGEDPS